MASFAQQMLRWTTETKKSYRDIITEGFIRLGKILIERTPVGDPSLWISPPPANYEAGTLVNNYFASLGTALAGVRGLRSQNISGSDSLKNIMDIAKVAPGNVAFIVNPTPYANRIEYDAWSTQAPAGMVRLSAAQWSVLIRLAARANR